MGRVVLITQHHIASKRKAGFHWLADAYWRMGWDVLFFTAYISPISWFRGERRFPRGLLWRATREARRVIRVEERLFSYVWFTPWHPANLRSPVLNRLTNGLFSRYGDLPLGASAPLVTEADLFVFEPTPGLLLFDAFKRRNPDARYVYRVSDDLRVLGRHPCVVSEEERVAPQFDLVSAPSRSLYERFAHLPNAALHFHGVDLATYGTASPSPYPRGSTNAVFIGHALLDVDFVVRAAIEFPDVTFHLIGQLPSVPSAANIRTHGELPFAEMVPYVQHADIGLHTLQHVPGAEVFSDSLKVHQYTYCRLPIIAPDFLRSERKNVCYYTPGNTDSIREALLCARSLDRTAAIFDSPPTWDSLARTLAGTADVSTTMPAAGSSGR